jgi:hypothetical protein
MSTRNLVDPELLPLIEMLPTRDIDATTLPVSILRRGNGSCHSRYVSIGDHRRARHRQRARGAGSDALDRVSLFSRPL